MADSPREETAPDLHGLEEILFISVYRCVCDLCVCSGSIVLGVDSAIMQTNQKTKS